MAKMLINLTIPAISESYDLNVPDFLCVRFLIPVLVDAISELSAGRYVSSGREYLCCLDHNRKLDPDSTIRENGIQNGDHLFIF